MNYSKYDSKLDPKKNNAGHASVTPPSTPDTRKGGVPAQADDKDGEVKPAVQAPGAPGTGNAAKSNGQDHNPPARTDGQATVKAAAAGDKADNEAMVNEGGHASPGKAPDAVREPDASTPVKNEPSKGSADGAADKPGLSAKSDR
jgi:hypothetical protein